jgi:hypothetical protein
MLSLVIKAACTCNIALISFCILLSWVSIVCIRFQIRLLLRIRTIAITNPPVANAMYSRQSSRTAMSDNLSYIVRSTSATARLRLPWRGIARRSGGWT